MMELYLIKGCSVRQLAGLTGMSRQRVTRWLERLTGRLMDDKYLNIYQDRESRSKLQMAIAYEHYLLGLSVRSIAEKLKVSRVTVGKTIRELEEMSDNATGEKT
jgi:DNA-binding MarR family transcriptional regulator